MFSSPPRSSKHVLTEDIVHREVTADHKLLSRRLLTKTNRMPRWAERFFPANVAHSVYILEDSIVDPKNRTMTTFTWNINHARLMVGACVCARPGAAGSGSAHSRAVPRAEGGGALRVPGEPGKQQLDRGQAGSLGFFQPVWRLTGCPGECCQLPQQCCVPSLGRSLKTAAPPCSTPSLCCFFHHFPPSL